MQEVFQQEIIKEVQNYFSESERKILKGDLLKLPEINEYYFWQITQKEEKPFFEIVFKTNRSLCNYTFQQNEKSHFFVRISNIHSIYLIEKPQVTNFKIFITSSRILLESDVFAEKSRQKAKEFFSHLIKEISRE